MAITKTSLRNITAGVRLGVEIVFDPDGYHIKLDGYNDIKFISPISGGVDMDIDFINQLVVNDVTITLNDKNELLNLVSKRPGFHPFRYEYNYTQFTHVPASYYFTCTSAADFILSDLIRVSNGVTTDIFQVTEITGTSIFYEPGAVSNDYSVTGCLAVNEPFINKRVYIYATYEEIGVDSDRELVFIGLIKEPFRWVDGEATITIYNIFAEALNKELTVNVSGEITNHDAQYITNAAGAMVDSLIWSVQTGSGALADVTIYNGASCGRWDILFSDATNFTVTGPNCEAKAGTVGGDFYDQTDATDSQIKIATADWSGTPAAGDNLGFYISVNFNDLTVPEIILSLLYDHAEIDSNFIDWSGTLGSDNSYSFDRIYNYLVLLPRNITISFSEQQTVAEALAIIIPHYMVMIGQKLDGKIGMLFFLSSATLNTLGGTESRRRKNTHAGSIKIGRTRYCNNIIINYGWDYINSKYLYSYDYPGYGNKFNQSLITEIRTKTINLPGIYTASKAAYAGGIYYRIFSFGADVLEYDLPMSEIATSSFGQMLRIPIGTTSTNDQNIQIYKTELSLISNFKIHITGHRLRV